MIRRALVGVLVILPLTALTQPPSAQAAPGETTVCGRILNFDGRPFQGVQVWIYSEPDNKRGFHTRTKADGTFVLRKLPVGSYWLAIVRIDRADDFSADHIHVKSGDVWELEYSLQHRAVTLHNVPRKILRKFYYQGGTPDQLAAGAWKEIISPQKPSNQTMQRTATRCAITFSMIKTLPLRLALAPGSRR